MMQNQSKIPIILKLFIGICILAAIAPLVIRPITMQFFSSPSRYQSRSPNNNKQIAEFICEGFVDRGFNFFVQDPVAHRRCPLWVGKLDWDGNRGFAGVVWSHDGTVVAAKIRVFVTESYPEVYGFAYDFKNHLLVRPYWDSSVSTTRKTVEEWKNHSKSIEELLQSRGGLKLPEITVEEIQRKASFMFYWQTPDIIDTQ